MKYTNFSIENYRAIRSKISIDLKSRLIPLVGVNECGKTTILQAILCFDETNDTNNSGKQLESIENLYITTAQNDCVITASIEWTGDELNKCIQKAIRIKEKPHKVPQKQSLQIQQG